MPATSSGEAPWTTSTPRMAGACQSRGASSAPGVLAPCELAHDFGAVHCKLAPAPVVAAQLLLQLSLLQRNKSITLCSAAAHLVTFASWE